ncbi:MAG: hypothetical protein ACRBN8_24550 [Nannocystales bacterium]
MRTKFALALADSSRGDARRSDSVHRSLSSIAYPSLAQKAFYANPTGPGRKTLGPLGPSVVARAGAKRKSRRL